MSLISVVIIWKNLIGYRSDWLFLKKCLFLFIYIRMDSVYKINPNGAFQGGSLRLLTDVCLMSEAKRSVISYMGGYRIQRTATKAFSDLYLAFSK